MVPFIHIYIYTHIHIHICTCIYIQYNIVNGTAMQIQKALINDRLRFTKVSWKFRIPTVYNFAVTYPWNLLFPENVAYFLTVSIVFSVNKQNFKAHNSYECENFCVCYLWSYIYYYIICMTITLVVVHYFTC